MMKVVKPGDMILDTNDLARRTAQFVKAFMEDLGFSPPLKTGLSFHPEPSTQSAAGVDTMTPPVFSEWDDGRIVLHLSTPDLVYIPALALQGWLDFELAAVMVQQQDNRYRYNFSRDILPLFPVSGSAVQFLRYLVFHLEDCLKRAEWTDMILKMEHGLPLAYYFYFMTAPSAEEKANYQNMVSHYWMKAIFICKKCKELLPIVLLDARGCLPGLTSFWWHCHSYLQPRDRVLMQQLVAVAVSCRDHLFSARMGAVFDVIKSELLH